MVFFVSLFLFFPSQFQVGKYVKIHCKIEKLLKSVGAFLVEIKEKGLATNAKQVSIYPTNWLIKKIPKVDYLITMATETDILEVLVTFIKKTEFIDNDLATFLQLVEDLDLVSLDLESLIINPGIYYKTMATKLISGSLKH